MVMAPPPTHDSAASLCFCGCLAFLHRHFPPQSPSSHPLDLSHCSQQEPLPGVLFCCSERGPPGRGPTLVQCLRSLMGQPLYCSVADAGVWKERLWYWPHPLCVTRQYRLASVAAWLSSTGISHHNLLPHPASIQLSTINSIPKLQLQPLPLPEDLSSCPAYVWLQQGLSDSHSIQAATDQVFHSQP